MANPTRRWDRVPVYGWYRTIDDQRIGGRVPLKRPSGITRVDRRAIYPDAKTITTSISDTDHDPEVRDAVRAHLRAQDEAAASHQFDPDEWDAWWDKYLDGAI